MKVVGRAARSVLRVGVGVRLMIVVSHEMTPGVSWPRAGGHLHNRCGVWDRGADGRARRGSGGVPVGRGWGRLRGLWWRVASVGVRPVADVAGARPDVAGAAPTVLLPGVPGHAGVERLMRDLGLQGCRGAGSGVAPDRRRPPGGRPANLVKRRSRRTPRRRSKSHPHDRPCPGPLITPARQDPSPCAMDRSCSRETE